MSDYCAVSIRTESGDDYVFLCWYSEYEDIVEHIYDKMDEELGYVYTISVDSGYSAEKDDEIENAIWFKVNQLKDEQ